MALWWWGNEKKEHIFAPGPSVAMTISNPTIFLNQNILTFILQSLSCPSAGFKHCLVVLGEPDPQNQ